jgi:hypothetical protein
MSRVGAVAPADSARRGLAGPRLATAKDVADLVGELEQATI